MPCPSNLGGATLCKCRRISCSRPYCKATPACGQDTCATHAKKGPT